MGAYCPAADFLEEMLEQTRRILVVKNGSVEIAPLGDIHIWIASSKEVTALQVANNSAGRSRRRQITNVPRRQTRNVRKHIGNHEENCNLCDIHTGTLILCYGCDAAVHEDCAKKDNQNNMLCLPNGVTRWACDSCYFDAHGGGPDDNDHDAMD